MKRKGAFQIYAFVLLALFTIPASAIENEPTCSGEYYMCDSWSGQFLSDLQNNCSGGYDVYVEWIEGC